MPRAHALPEPVRVEPVLAALLLLAVAAVATWAFGPDTADGTGRHGAPWLYAVVLPASMVLVRVLQRCEVRVRPRPPRRRRRGTSRAAHGRGRRQAPARSLLAAWLPGP
ncbi:MAG: hypothetical protein KatS3mg126_1638 [Lysobacteraceae bacterium]|nr:MAG: hypothetical protein KatS3mg126_1638 [Xanthomonadaceae bacterium]